MTSLWHGTAQLPEFPPLEGDTKTDVLIIGGGIAGILTAHFLEQRGIDYVLVENGRICGGTTGNTTAKITYQHGLCYSRLLKSGGVDTANLYLQANKAALEKYTDMCGDIDCDFELRDNFVYSSDRRKLEDELTALDAIGYGAELVDDLPIPIETAGAVCFKEQAQFHPLKFVAAIANALNIYENTHVREMVGNIAVTDHGRISAKQVVVATHFPFINKHGSYFLKLYQHRSYVLALENACAVDGMYVDECDTGMSFRNRGALLLLGGGGHRTGKDGGNWTEIRAFAKTHYPDAREVFHWATQDCMSLDGIPYIGRYSKRTQELYVASGFNKWGMTGAMVSAMILSDILEGRHNEFAEVFDPSRSILKPQLFVNGAETVKNLLTFTEKRCPHLGCALKWNSAEHSWDCPCHGSRFDTDGEVLDNPANEGLR